MVGSWRLVALVFALISHLLSFFLIYVLFLPHFSFLSPLLFPVFILILPPPLPPVFIPTSSFSFFSFLSFIYSFSSSTSSSSARYPRPERSGDQTGFFLFEDLTFLTLCLGRNGASGAAFIPSPEPPLNSYYAQTRKHYYPSRRASFCVERKRMTCSSVKRV